MIRCRYGMVRQREIVLFAVINPISSTPEKKDMGKLQYHEEQSSVYIIIITLYTYIIIYLYNIKNFVFDYKRINLFNFRQLNLPCVIRFEN